jgi:hypothetical protein
MGHCLQKYRKPAWPTSVGETQDISHNKGRKYPGQFRDNNLYYIYFNDYCLKSYFC